MGRRGIEEAYRTGRGSITMRAVVDIDEDARGRACLIVTELPYQVNPDNLAAKIAELVQGRPGQRDRGRPGRKQRPDRAAAGDRAEAGRGRQGRAEQPVQAHPAAGHVRREHARAGGRRARTLRLDQLIRYWVAHQIEVIVRRTRYLLRHAQERAHIVRALLKAIDRIDEVIALIRGSASAAAAQQGLMELLEIDEEQARAILDMQLRQLAALERQALADEYEELMTKIADYEEILASPERQRQIIGDELGEIVAKYGDERRTRIIPFDGDVTDEDLIAEEDVVVTITHGGYAKRTKTDLYRAQRRGGKGVRGAQLRTDDIVNHFFVTTTHRWILFFTNKGRVYRAKAYELPDTARDARGQHVANLLAFQPDERIAEVLAIPDYSVAPYLVIATRSGPGQEVAADRLRLGPVRRDHRDQPARGREVIAASLVSPRRTCCWSAGRPSPSGSTPATTPCGRWAGHLRRHRHAVHQRRQLLNARGAEGRGRPGGHRWRVRQADPLGPVPAAGPWRPRRADRAHRRLPGRAGRRPAGAPEDEVFAITASGGVIRTWRRR